MRKYEHMRCEEFQEIYRRQKASGLNIEDFCINESYGKSSFYYWKKKYINNPQEEGEINRKNAQKAETGSMAPIRIKAENSVIFPFSGQA